LDFFQLTPRLTFYPAKEIEAKIILTGDAPDFYKMYWHHVDEDVTKLLCTQIADLDPAVPYFAEALLFRVYRYGFVARENGALTSMNALFVIYQMIKQWYCLERAADWDKLRSSSEAHFPIIFHHLFYHFWYEEYHLPFTAELVPYFIALRRSLQHSNITCYILRHMMVTVKDGRKRSYILWVVAQNIRQRNK
jgi:hypothetical protein